MKIFKAEQWNIEVLAPLFEAYRLANGMSENPDRTLTFLTNRMRFNESMFFIAVNENAQADWLCSNFILAYLLYNYNAIGN